MTEAGGRWSYADKPVVLLSYGGGVDSTAAAIEILESGGRIDAALFADTRSEKPETYEYVEMFKKYLAEFGVVLHIVSYTAKNWKNYPRYYGLEENCLTNGTLPSISFGFKSCSLKNKVQPQNAWTEMYPPAIYAWSEGRKVTKIIGYDSSAADNRRYAHRGNEEDPKYDFSYPLRELGWDRADCEARIRRSGLPVPMKSACFFCAASKADEIRALQKPLLRRIVLMEARAKPRLDVVEGLWRKAIKGRNGATPRPGSMTELIEAEELLPASEVAKLRELAPRHLLRFADLAGMEALDRRRALSDWFGLFEALTGMEMSVKGMPDLYADAGTTGADAEAA